MLKNKKPPHLNEALDVAKVMEITPHLHILVLRKSAGKLLEYVNSYKRRKSGANNIIKIKYELSQCRPEVLNIFLAMAKDPKRFEMEHTYSDDRIAFKDTLHSTRFRVYDWKSRGYQASINGEDFLNEHETKIMWNIAYSLNQMSKNQYKLQQELQALEKQKNVFEIYKNEKLQG